MKRYFVTAIKISFVVYIAILFIILFVRHRGNWWSDLSVFEYALMHMNLVPFKTILGYVQAIKEQTMNLNIPLENLFGNLLMFFPAGLYLPSFSDKIDSLKKFVLGMMPIFLVIEVVQFLTKRGAFDIDDLLLNMLGAVIGYLIWKSRPVQKLLHKINL